MAYVKDIGLSHAAMAGVDFTGKLNYLAAQYSDGTIHLAGAGGAVLGVVTEEAAVGYPVTVLTGGIGKVLLAGSVTAGNRLASDGNGKAVVSTTGNFEFGTALESGSAGNVISFQFGTGLGA